MNHTLKSELISALITFVSAFLVVLGAELSVTGGTELTQPVFFGAVMAAVRAGLKAITGRLGK